MLCVPMVSIPCLTVDLFYTLFGPIYLSDVMYSQRDGSAILGQIKENVRIREGPWCLQERMQVFPSSSPLSKGGPIQERSWRTLIL